MNKGEAAVPGVTVTAWARLLRAQRRGLSVVERKLKAGGLPSLEWYDVLLELERCGPMRPRELQSELLLPQSNLSRLLDRMEYAGLVDRASCPDDGRGLRISITKKGRAIRKRMWPVYAEGIQEAIGDRLALDDVEQLSRLLRPLSRQED